MWELFNERSPEKRPPSHSMLDWVNERAGESPAGPRDVAQGGIQSGGSALPHLEEVQRSFGRHDVRGVTAHTGDSVDTATDALGAKAYAHGQHVALGGEATSLHTVAHEAAHVVQQRRGVGPKGGLDGGPSDPHEQHANAVADRVVQGQSAEHLLDGVGHDDAAPASPAVQRAPKTKPKKSDQPSVPGARDLDTGIAAGQRALKMLEIARAIFPAYQRAVNALDALAALELARNVIGALNQADEGKREVIETLGTDPPQHWMVSTPGKPDLSEAAVTQKWSTLGGLKLRLMGEVTAFAMELAVQIGPQHLDGAPVMGAVTLPKLGTDPLPYLISEAGVVVEMLGVVNEAMRISGAKLGTCPQITPPQAQQIVKLIAPWKSRPVNFKFLVAALRKVGLWDEINSVKSEQGTTLAETNAAVAAQAKTTGALADVGDLDNKALDEMLGDRTEVVGDVVRTNRMTDGKAQRLLERLIGAAGDARGPLIKQIDKMGKLGDVCKHLPSKTIEALHDAIAPFDREAAQLLEPYYAGKGGGRSMHKIYEDKIMENIHDGHNFRAYLWTFLDTAHNALTAGFQREYSDAYDAREAGLITDEAFHSAAGKALGKAAAVTIASAATGGVAGEFSEGLATGLGASKSAASLIGAGVGGFGAGVGGHLAGDVFDQAANGKQGFDSFGSYMRSGAEGGLMGTVLGGISVGAGAYLGEAAPMRPIDDMAARYPRSTTVLERIRAAGFETGRQVKGAAAAVGTRVMVTAAELADMITSGLAVPSPRLAGATGRIPPNTQLEISVRPMQMSGIDKPKTGSATSSSASRGGTTKLEIEEVKVAPEVSVKEPAVDEPRASTSQPPSETAAGKATEDPVAQVSREGDSAASSSEASGESATPRSTIKAPQSGKEVEVATSGRAIVPTGKVEVYPRGKSTPFTDEMKVELKELKAQRQNARKKFDSEPKNARRIDELEKLKHNYERSVEMSHTLDNAGLPDTVAGNERMIKQLLDLGQTVTEGNNVNVPIELVGTNGKVLAETTWTILPDGRAYLSTLKLKPMKP